MTRIPLTADPAAEFPQHVHRLWPHPDGRTLAAFLGTEEAASELVVWDVSAERVIARHTLITDEEHGTC